MATYKSLLQYWKSQRESLSPEQVKWQIEDLKTQVALLRDENQQLKVYTETLKASLEKIS
jgi:regulator of replication initiation timing